MPRFVVLEHQTSAGIHWDFMLEEHEHLRTWSLPAEPKPQTQLHANELAPHRAIYLEYEGPISAGRGTVKQWDTGRYRFCSQSQPEKVRIHIWGKKLSGTIELQKIGESSPLWLFRWLEPTNVPPLAGEPCCGAEE